MLFYMNFYGNTAVVDFLDVNLLLGSDWTDILNETAKLCPGCKTSNSVRRRPFCRRRTSVCSAVILLFVRFETEITENEF